MTATAQAATTSEQELEPNKAFRKLEIIRDPDGVIAVISAREKDGRVSFMIGREFEVGAETKTTAYLSRRHLAACRRLLADLEERLELAEDQARAKLRDR